MDLVDLILHTDDALLALVASNLLYAYLILFLIIFLETGCLLFPFLPGDGLLFSAGVIAATTELDITWLIPLLIGAAVAGNLCNYFLGRLLGNRLLSTQNRWVVKYLLPPFVKTSQFYDSYGAGSIIAGRFFPIVRTYIPFLAGVVIFPYRKFVFFSITGAAVWVLLFTLIGYFVGEIPWVQNNYGLIFLGLIVLTSLPIAFKILQSLWRRRRGEILP